MVLAVKSAGRFEWSWGPFEGLKAAGIISHGFIAIWKPNMAPTFKEGHHYTCNKRFWSQRRIKLTDSNGVCVSLHVLKDTGTVGLGSVVFNVYSAPCYDVFRI